MLPNRRYYSLSFFFFFSSRRRHTRSLRDWSSDVCSSDLEAERRRRHPAVNPAVGNVVPRRAAVRAHLPLDGRAGIAARGGREGRVPTVGRSEERRVGKECRSGWAGGHSKKKGQEV